MSTSYWDRVLNRRITRRRALAASGAAAGAAAFLAACGDDQPDEVVGEPGTPRVGGHLIWQAFGDPGGGLELITARNAGVNMMASLTHDSLLDFAYGLPQYPGIGLEVIPNLALALPELSPDRLTLTFKITDRATFHDGKPLTSEDVKWTWDTKAFAPESAHHIDLVWLDSTETPDPTTFVMHLKSPHADIMQIAAYKNHAGVLHREHHESGASERSFLGSGPFLFEEYRAPTLMRYRRNPDYWRDDAGWFEEIDMLGTSDSEKKVADLIAGQVHVTYWFPAEERDRILGRRRDLQMFDYPWAGSGTVYFRNDVPPFNDRRVRQALSMGYDRSILAQTTAAGDESLPDQVLSRSGTAWEFRGPEELPRSDLYELNVVEARRLLAAAQVELPLRFDLPHWNATVIGQKFVDEIVSIATQWRNHGLADANHLEETFGQFGPRFVGNYDHVHWGPNVTSTLPELGIALKNKYWSPPEGVRAPTLNLSYVNIPELNELVVKQNEEFDRTARIQVFRRMEEILSEEMVHASGVTRTQTYFIDPIVKNAQMPRDAYNGSVAWMKYWWM